LSAIETTRVPDPAAAAYTRARRAHWDQVGRESTDRGWGGYYHRRLTQVVCRHVAPGQSVLEVGCGGGDLLAAVRPRLGVGIDFSASMLAQARARHPHLRFVQADAHSLPLSDRFDVIILSDLVNDLWDVQRVFEQLRPLCRANTRLILNFHSHLWQQPLDAAKTLGIARPTLEQNWLTVDDAAHLLRLSDFEVLWTRAEVLWPFATPLVAPLANRVLVRLWPFNRIALTHVVVARPNLASEELADPRVSVVVAARNEAGNIERLFQELPEMGREMEIVFVEGHSSDQTYEAIERAIAAHPERRCKLFRQRGKGKGDAVRLGFDEASGDVLMILDADLTVPPADLPRFLEALRSGKAEFVNGVRLVYPMEGEAMRFFNVIGNKFFSLAFSWLLEQPIKDTLCGTKVISKKNYERLTANRGQFGDFDPYGDYDLLFGAAALNLRIVDLPVRYRQRTYGAPNIQRWRDGVLLLRMCLFAARRIKFT